MNYTFVFCLLISILSCTHNLLALSPPSFKKWISCFCSLQFLQNQGFLASISNENEIQVLILHELSILLLFFFSIAKLHLGLYCYCCKFLHFATDDIDGFNRLLWYWQVWDLQHRQIACTLQWESNITAFSVIDGTTYMYGGLLK